MNDPNGPSAPLGDPEGHQRQRSERGRGKELRLVATGALLVLLVWFALANLQGVRIHFWLTSTTAPLIVVIAIAGALGAGVASLVGRLARRRRRPGEGDPW